MTADFSSFRPLRRGLSLERKLPVAASALLVVLLGLYTWIAYYEVSQAGIMGALERDTRIADELARLTGVSSAARSRLISTVVNKPAVHAALTGAAPIESIDSALTGLRTQTDSSLRVVVFDAQRRPIHYMEGVHGPEITSHLEPLFAAADRRDSLSVSGPFFDYKGRAHFWTLAAARSGGRTLGYIAHFRAVRTAPASVRALNALAGSDNRILFANRDDARTTLVELDGTLLPAPLRTRVGDRVLEYERDGERYLAAAETVAATPYSVVLETPYTATQARAHQFLRRTGLLGLLLLTIGTLIVWTLSRRFTRPITELNAAAASIAAGRLGQQVEVRRNDELGELADSFNQMSGEIQRAMLEAEDSRAEAEQANRAKSEFLANMSHEIRTPINAMLGYADLMEAGVSGPLTDMQRDQLARVKVSGKHLIRMIDDLLDFARIETARLSIEKHVAQASEAVRTALTVIEPQADAKPVSVSSDIHGDPHYIGDPQRVEQILVNLLGNAVKFTPPNGSVRVECRTLRPNGASARTQFVVEDTGPGIPRDRLEHVFEPFVQGHTGYTRPHGGSGLGLTISQRLAGMMDGKIEVESEEGAGARFTLTLPAPS